MSTAAQRPTRLNLALYGGDDFTLRFEFSFSLTGYTDWKAQVKTNKASTDAIDFTIDDSEQGDDVIVCDLTTTDTRAIRNGSVWDMQVVDSDGKLRTLFAGKVTNEGDVTT